MITRSDFEQDIRTALARAPIVGLVGPRQCGKTTLARDFVDVDSPNYFDLEDPVSLARLESPMAALSALKGLVVIDEIQRRPDLFPMLRVLADRKNQPAQFLILGSASPQLMSSASESLAGRIEVIEITPFNLKEIPSAQHELRWSRGGFPRSFLANDEPASQAWRANFISRFLEQDIPQLGIKIPAARLRRFWTMLAHYHGQTWNGAEIGSSLGLTAHTVRSYLDLLSDTFMVRQLQPWFENVKKRQVKSPRIYFRDSGLFHQLLGIKNYDELQLHPKLGASWEGFAIEETIRAVQPEDIYFWSVHSGPELDLLCFKNKQRLGFEIKYMDAPKLTKSMRTSMDLLKLDHLTIVYPGRQSYPLADNIEVIPLTEFRNRT